MKAKENQTKNQVLIGKEISLMVDKWGGKNWNKNHRDFIVLFWIFMSVFKKFFFLKQKIGKVLPRKSKWKKKEEAKG